MQVGVAEIRLPVAGMQQIEIAWPWPHLDGGAADKSWRLIAPERQVD
jgi:hypothetical protein